MAHLLGYARVSSLDLNPQQQGDKLKTAGCDRVFTDHTSDAATSQPALDEALDQLRLGDTLVVCRLARLGRSLGHLIDVVTDLDARGVGFRSLWEKIDTTTTWGRLVIHLFVALRQFERDLIAERSTLGLAAAPQGRNGSRPTQKIDSDGEALARRMRDEQTHTLEQIADVLGVSRSTVVRSLRRTGERKKAGTP